MCDGPSVDEKCYLKKALQEIDTENLRDYCSEDKMGLSKSSLSMCAHKD